MTRSTWYKIDFSINYYVNGLNYSISIIACLQFETATFPPKIMI